MHASRYDLTCLALVFFVIQQTASKTRSTFLVRWIDIACFIFSCAVQWIIIWFESKDVQSTNLIYQWNLDNICSRNTAFQGRTLIFQFYIHRLWDTAWGNWLYHKGIPPWTECSPRMRPTEKWKKSSICTSLAAHWCLESDWCQWPVPTHWLVIILSLITMPADMLLKFDKNLTVN